MDASANQPSLGDHPVKILDADGLYVEEVLSARHEPSSTKISAGIELFDFACESSKSGIRCEFPDADEDRVLEILRKRLALGRRLEDGW